MSGALFFLFGCFLTLGHFIGKDAPRAGETGYASGQYGGLITGFALGVAGLYILVKTYGKQT
ncbi:MAG TPA: hypothetical protein VJT09_11555 [Pyrinomonadaceae bacterium]|nr:hypothetical protein [Pyrinomonadaceae bacterium]